MAGNAESDLPLLVPTSDVWLAFCCLRADGRPVRICGHVDINHAVPVEGYVKMVVSKEKVGKFELRFAGRLRALLRFADESPYWQIIKEHLHVRGMLIGQWQGLTFT